MGSIIAQGCDEFGHPAETSHIHFVEHELRCVPIHKPVVEQINEDGCTDNAFIDDDTPVVVGLLLHFESCELEKLLTNAFHQRCIGGIVKQGVDERMVELVDKK